MSLGSNCEVGFQIKRVLQRQVSGFFNWNVTSPTALISLLTSHFDGILQKDKLSFHGNGALVRDSSHDFMVHHRFDKTLFKDEPEFDDKLRDLAGKFTHFIESFETSARQPGETVYFYKGVIENPQSFALEVQSLLCGYHGNADFDLVIIQTEDCREPDWKLDRIHNRYLKRFAPASDAPDGHVQGWDKIFREFPHRDGLHLANYQ